MRVPVPIGALLILTAVAGTATAQRPDSSAPAAGRLIERVTSLGDTSQHFAIYFPRGYDPAGRWPVLLAMDPRGRALLPLERFRPAADRLGWVILSSYNTRSDTNVDPNRDALNAMISGAQRHLRIDATRLYLAGFSGTARDAWDFAYQLQGHVAGIICFGAGFPYGWLPPAESPGSAPPVYFGGAGTLDFNYDELLALDHYVDGLGMVHHRAIFNGPHGWPPAPVMQEAMDWMELQAIRRQLRPPDPAWVDSLYRARLDSARTLESAGDAFAAWDRYRLTRDDFAGLHDTTAAGREAARLAHSRPVVQALQREQQLAGEYREYLKRIEQFNARQEAMEQPPRLDQALKTLEIAKLQRAVKEARDTLTALSKQRLLEYAFTSAGFYQTRAALTDKKPEWALLMLDVAAAIHPGSPVNCAQRKQALAMLGRDTSAAAHPCPGSATPPRGP